MKLRWRVGSGNSSERTAAWLALFMCAKAKALLTEMGYDYAEIPLDHKVRTKVVGAIAGAQTVPQVFINGTRIGGWEDLEAWARKAA